MLYLAKEDKKGKQLLSACRSDTLQPSKRLVMSPERLPAIGSSETKARVKPPVSSQANRRKRYQQQTTPSSTTHPSQGPSSIFLSDTTVAPWEGLALCESSFTLIAPPRPPPQPPPAPRPTPSTPHCERQNKEEASSSSLNSAPPSPPVLQNGAVGRSRGLQARRRITPQHRGPRPPRLPPLRPVTNLSFSRSFTFSFFELPLHQAPGCRAERIRNLMLLLRQIHY